MAQRVTLFLVAAALTVPVLAAAQTVRHPDFTGTWKIANIEMPEARGNADRGGFGGRRGLGGGGGRGYAGRRGGANGDPDNANGGRGERPQPLEVGQTIRIRQTDDRLIVTEDNGQGVATMNSYSLDGKESANRTGPATTKSKTRWEGVALVTDITRSMQTQRGGFEMKSREVRSLGDDGMTMTVRTEFDTPRGKQAMTVTYAKTPE